MKTYKSCVDAHAEFHMQAAKVVQMINMGEYKAAEAMLANDTPFTKAYSALGAAYLALKFAVLQRILQAGWQITIPRSRPRLRGKDMLNYLFI